jgi:hypothetical protein
MIAAIAKSDEKSRRRCWRCGVPVARSTPGIRKDLSHYGGNGRTTPKAMLLRADISFRKPHPSRPRQPCAGFCIGLRAALPARSNREDHILSLAAADLTNRRPSESVMSIGTILIILVLIYLLGGWGWPLRGLGYGLGHSGMGRGGVVLVELLVRLIPGKLLCL